MIRSIEYKDEILFNYFSAGVEAEPEHPFLVDYHRNSNVRKRLTLDALALDAEWRTRVANFGGEAMVQYFIATHNKQWHAENKSLLYKDVCTVFMNGEFINSSIVHRACEHMRHFAGAEDRVHIVNTRYLPCLMYDNPFLDHTMHANENNIKEYITEYPESSWTAHLDAGHIVFVPLNYPKGTHWVCAVLWKNESGHYIRVYNSMAAYSRHDLTCANACAHVCACMDPKNYGNIKWKFFQPHDEIEQRAHNHRCGLHVVARAWQVCMNEHLDRVMNLGAFDSIVAFLRKEFLDYATTLCGEGVFPKEKLL